MSSDISWENSCKSKIAWGKKPRATRDIKVSQEKQAEFWSMVEDKGECWEWTGRKTHGYGYFSINSIGWRVHRLSLFLLERLDDELCVDHLCGNKACVKPSHLDQVTPLENLDRARIKPTHCPSGHKYTKENTYTSPIQKNGGVVKYCRECNRVESRTRSKKRYSTDPEFRRQKREYFKKKYYSDPEFRRIRNEKKRIWRAKRKAMGLKHV